jgi:alpha-ribazole phosphatase
VASKTIYLLRHGKIALDGEQRRYIGQTDLPLDAEGVRQSERLQVLLERAGFTAVYCSDLVRSQATAKIIAGKTGARTEIYPGLREISLGEWEGLTFAEVAHSFPEQFEARGRDLAYYRTPGGESFADCGRRVMEAFRKIAAEGEDPVVIVGHAGVNRLILCHVLGMPLANLFRINQDFACINIIQHLGNTSRVKAMNWTLK